jgi:uncharacterized protein
LGNLEVDYQKAVEYFKLSANQENQFAQYNLATMYENGHGVEEDLVKAKEYYQLSANQGYEPAKEALERLAKADEK